MAFEWWDVVEGRTVPMYCIDHFEWPNRLGALPDAARTAQEGEAECARVGKRLCTEDEWFVACAGRDVPPRDYPYEDAAHKGHRDHVCNDDKKWRQTNDPLMAKWPDPAAKKLMKDLYQGDPSGTRANCKSPEGVFDLTGNVAEWVTRTRNYKANYPHVMKGCYWGRCLGDKFPTCGFTNPAHPGNYRTYEVGFRCCATPRWP
jgi:formylglycine-generating enzyme required for sulfatase activity